MPALDQDVLNELRSIGGDELVSEVVAAYIAEATAEVEGLNAAVSAADPEALERVAHRFKSSSAAVGALEVSAFAEQLQQLGRSGTTEGAATIVEALEAAWRAADMELAPLAAAA